MDDGGWEKCSLRLGGPGRLDKEGYERSVELQEAASHAEIGGTDSRQREQ